MSGLLGTLGKLVVALLAAVVILPWLIWAAFAAIRAWDYVDEQWPNGSTRSVRSELERVLPPPADAEFVTVWRYGGHYDVPYRENVYYRSGLERARIVDHYRVMLERH